MKIQKHKKTALLVLSLLILSVLTFVVGKAPVSDSAKISFLNSKYGLVAAEPLDAENASPRMASLFRASIFNTNVLGLIKPEKELVLKLNSGNKEDLQNIFVLKLRTESDLKEVAADYKKLATVSYAEPNYSVKLGGRTVAVNKVQNPISRVTPAKTGVIVAVIDSGIDTQHKDFKNRIVTGWDFIEDTKTVIDTFGHGTHVSGIILKNSKSAKIMPLRFTDGESGKMSDLVRAIKFATDNNAQIINLSLGLPENSKVLKEATDYAENKNVIVVAAAGNSNSSKKFYPAALGKVVAVAALNAKGEKLYQSNFGTWVDYSAKGQDIYSTLPGDKYGYMTGTSQAAPEIVAKIADIINSEKEYSIKTVTSELQQITHPVKKGSYAGLLGRTP